MAKTGRADAAGSQGAIAIAPSRDEFSRVYGEGRAQVVYTRLVADLETPVSAYLKLVASRPGGTAMSFLLESVEGGQSRGRYSVIGLAPDAVWRADGNTASINRTPTSKPGAYAREVKATLASLRDFLAESRLALPDELPPMAAGVFGHMGYDTIRLVEHLPNVNADSLGVPDSVLMRPTLIVIFDSVKDEMTLVTPVRPSEKKTAEQAYRVAVKRLKAVVAALETPLSHQGSLVSRKLATPEPRSNTSAAEYLAMVGKAKEYIRAGDIFQVVLSQRFSAPFTLPSLALYRSLRRLNPSPFLFHLDLGSYALVGSSPEILVRVRDGRVTVRPIAGTARRGASETEDARLADALIRDPKERAEHLMLLDLGRNDVGRVAKVGSVEVTDQFIIERYSHVMHIVSNVVGALDRKCDAVEALLAGFPAGTVSGAPKVRAMQIIDELEKAKRGPYAGCVGYFSADGEMDTCIVLRTAILKDGMMHVQAGAGVVYDSVAENEQQECINKAKAVIRAAEDAVQYAARGRRTKSGPGNGGPFD